MQGMSDYIINMGKYGNLQIFHYSDGTVGSSWECPPVEGSEWSVCDAFPGEVSIHEEPAIPRSYFPFRPPPNQILYATIEPNIDRNVTYPHQLCYHDGDKEACAAEPKLPIPCGLRKDCIEVYPGDDLKKAIRSTKPGDTIEFPEGGVFDGGYHEEIKQFNERLRK